MPAQAVDASLAHFHSSHHRTTEAAYAEVLPFLCDQAVDWEKVALAGGAAWPAPRPLIPQCRGGAE